MRDKFLRIRALGVITDAWLINNRAEVIHSQLTGSVNKKMLAEISQRVLQLMALQAAYIGAGMDYLMLFADEQTLFAFDLGPLVLVTMNPNSIESTRVLDELRPIAQEFRNDARLVARYAKKGLERRDMIAEARLDDKARGLLQELKKSTF